MLTIVMLATPRICSPLLKGARQAHGQKNEAADRMKY
jgi:hypothetical protein